MTTPLSVSTRLQQFALAQLDRAIDELTTANHKTDTAIHATRRAVKRVRALLRLVQSELPTAVYDRDNLFLRNIGRRLSALRDAAVIAETLRALKKEAAGQFPPALWRELKQDLVGRTGSSAAHKEKRLIAVVARLRTVRARVEKWPLEFDDLAALQQGVRKAYRRGQRTLAKALANPSADHFHEWRKQVNHLRHQLQLLQTLRLGNAKPTLHRLKALAELLGQKNDLALLSQQLARRGKAKAPMPPMFQTLLQTRDMTLTEAIIGLGQQLYRPRPKALLRSLWKRD